MIRKFSGTFRQGIIYCILFLLVTSCNLPIFSKYSSTNPPIQKTPTSIKTRTITPKPDISLQISNPIFQVFILNPIITCIAGNDFFSGNVCYGKNCGDCNCTWEEFDPPAPLTGIPPDQIHDAKYKNFEQRLCFEITLSESEINQITQDMLEIHDLVLEWTDGALDLQMDIRTMPFTHTGFVAPDFVFGPFEVDDELLNNYVSTDTDFVYVITGQTDHTNNMSLAGWCGGSYGEMSIHGAGYSYIQYNDSCNSVFIGVNTIYEPLIHEWIHNLDWALYNINQVNDIYQFNSPDWTNWDAGDWPGCDQWETNPLKWFPSIDYCEWDPDWIDCNNESSAGTCIHASDSIENPSWYEHVISTHYPRFLNFNGNFCQDERMDWGETGIDVGGSCP